jgi:hypothetical protein
MGKKSIETCICKRCSLRYGSNATTRCYTLPFILESESRVVIEAT